MGLEVGLFGEFLVAALVGAGVCLAVLDGLSGVVHVYMLVELPA